MSGSDAVLESAPVLSVSGAKVHFGGARADVIGLDAHRMSWSGIARTFQTIRLLPTLTVRDNVRLGIEHRRAGRAVPSREDTAAVDDALERLDITAIAGRFPDGLSCGTRRRVEIEHDLRTMLSICHRLLVMNFGHLSADGIPHEVAARPDVQEVYLGAGHGSA